MEVQEIAVLIALYADESIRRAKILLEKRAEVARIKPIVREYQTRILAENRWINELEKPFIDVHGNEEKYKERIIRSPEETHWLADDDFNEYLRLCYQECIKAGFHVEDSEHCPLMDAEYCELQAEKDFVTFWLKHIPEAQNITFEKFKFTDPDRYRDILDRALVIIQEYLENK